jgi:chloramphenicol 3-O-phosphotransferase
MPGPRLIHLNGPPGIGKSTIAQRYVDAHPMVLNCDIDVLRTLVGGWRDDFGTVGALIRPAAQAFIAAYLEDGHDVVLPQLIARVDELRRFEAVATAAGAEFVEVMLMDDRTDAIARFDRRGGAEPVPGWHDQVRAIVAAEGGAALLGRFYDALEELLAQRPDALVVRSVEGAVDETYQAVVDALRA